MLKFLGSGVALAVGAGAFYYWWTHEHANTYDHMERAAGHLHDMAKKSRSTIEDV